MKYLVWVQDYLFPHPPNSGEGTESEFRMFLETVNAHPSPLASSSGSLLKNGEGGRGESLETRLPSPPHPLTSSLPHLWHPVWRSGSDQLEGTDIFTLDPPSSWEEVSICLVHHNYVC